MARRFQATERIGYDDGMQPPSISIALALAFPVVMIITEIIRSIVDRRRLKARGVGGTEDILIVGLLIGSLCIAGAVAMHVYSWFAQ